MLTRDTTALVVVTHQKPYALLLVEIPLAPHTHTDPPNYAHHTHTPPLVTHTLIDNNDGNVRPAGEPPECLLDVADRCIYG